MSGASATTARSPSSFESRIRSGLRSSRSRLSSDKRWLMGPQIIYENVPVCRAALAVSQAVEFECNEIAQPEGREDISAKRDNFGIGQWFDDPYKLNPDLVKLAIAALLRTLVSKHRPPVEQFQRHMLGQAVGNEGAGHAGRVFRTKRDAVSTAIGEGVHFLSDDIRTIAEGTGEDLGEFEYRGGYFAEPVLRGDSRTRGAPRMAPPSVFVGQNIACAANRASMRAWEKDPATERRLGIRIAYRHGLPDLFLGGITIAHVVLDDGLKLGRQLRAPQRHPFLPIDEDRSGGLLAGAG